MKISLDKFDILQSLAQLPQLQSVNNLEFQENSLLCSITLDSKQLGVIGMPENWIVELNFGHTNETMTASLKILSNAETKLGKTANKIAQKMLNGIINLIGLEEKIIGSIKLPEFASSEGNSITIDMNRLLSSKLDCSVNINSVNCRDNALTFDFYVDFELPEQL